MAETDLIAQTLLMLLDNQTKRTRHALANLANEVFVDSPGGDCKSILRIAAHLVHLVRFQLTLLESPLVDQIAEASADDSAADIVAQLEAGHQLLRQAITDHDPADWLTRPAAPRQGPWGDEPTLARLTRPFNDFVNHLGAIRAIRRILGNPAQGVQ